MPEEAMDTSQEMMVRRALKLTSEDIMGANPDMSKVELDGGQVILTLSYYTSKTLPKAYKSPMFAIFRENMEELYKATWGFKKEKKHAELFHHKSRYLVLEEDGCVAGFVHLRFTYDDEDEDPPRGLVYIYEIQLAPTLQRKGVGQRLMCAVEHVAKVAGLGKLKLTVFKCNDTAIQFYRHKLGYDVDGACPSKWNRPNEAYMLLSKLL